MSHFVIKMRKPVRICLYGPGYRYKLYHVLYLNAQWSNVVSYLDSTLARRFALASLITSIMNSAIDV